MDSVHHLTDADVTRLWPQVSYQARWVKRKLPDYSALDRDDLEQEGWVGILRASDQYDAQKTKNRDLFLVYRARMAMWDAVRRWEWSAKKCHLDRTYKARKNPDRYAVEIKWVFDDQLLNRLTCTGPLRNTLMMVEDGHWRSY